MGANDCNIAGLRIGIVQGYVLFNVEVEDGLLRVKDCMGIFANVLARDNVLDDVEGEHDCRGVLNARLIDRNQRGQRNRDLPPSIASFQNMDRGSQNCRWESSP